jgi:HSP20 family protein
VQTPEAYQVKADLPGVARDMIELEVDGDTISISVKESKESESDEEAPGGGRTVHRMERSSSFVRRTVRMPDSADMEKVHAGYKDGVLTLDVPKADDAVARRRQIPVKYE